MERSNISYTQQVLLACHQITHTINSIELVRQDYDLIPLTHSNSKSILDSQKERSEVLEETIKKLMAIAEDLNDYVNNCDMVQEEDELISRASWAILNSIPNEDIDKD